METQVYKGFHIATGFEGDCQKVVVDERFYRDIATYLDSDDVVLDIGACFGTFAVKASPLVAKVISYEPGEDNFTLLKMNTKGLANVECLPAAVIGDCRPYVEFFMGSNGTIHSTTKYRGRNSVKVPAVNFVDQLDQYSPSVLKIDIEGGEYEFRELWNLPNCVRALLLEIHLNRREWRDGLAKQLVRAIEKQGFRWVHEPRFTRANWTTNVVAAR